MRFPMTLGTFAKCTTFGAVALMALLGGFLLTGLSPLHPPLRPLVAGVLSLELAALALTLALAPRAVKLSQRGLVVERWCWPDFVLPWSEVTAVEPGPPLRVGGEVRRIAGNGGLMAFSGLFHVASVGLVRCWATRLGVPTVLVRRARTRPLLLGVDAPSELLQALRGVPALHKGER